MRSDDISSAGTTGGRDRRLEGGAVDKFVAEKGRCIQKNGCFSLEQDNEQMTAKKHLFLQVVVTCCAISFKIHILAEISSSAALFLSSCIEFEPN